MACWISTLNSALCCFTGQHKLPEKPPTGHCLKLTIYAIRDAHSFYAFLGERLVAWLVHNAAMTWPANWCNCGRVIKVAILLNSCCR